MAIDERKRHQLYLRLEDLLGVEDATILMEHLPPAGWADVATMRDLDQLGVATKREFEGMGERFDLKLDSLRHELTATFRSDLVRQTRTLIVAMLGAVAGVGSLVVVAARLG